MPSSPALKPTTAAPSDAGLAPAPDPSSAAGLLGQLLLAALRGYKILISPLFAGSCRFTPSCADYMAEAIRTHGALAGVRLGLGRLARCHPWGPWGPDPVPGSQSGPRPSDEGGSPCAGSGAKV